MLFRMFWPKGKIPAVCFSNNLPCKAAWYDLPTSHTYMIYLPIYLLKYIYTTLFNLEYFTLKWFDLQEIPCGNQSSMTLTSLSPEDLPPAQVAPGASKGLSTLGAGPQGLLMYPDLHQWSIRHLEVIPVFMQVCSCSKLLAHALSYLWKPLILSIFKFHVFLIFVLS